jgi:hypothetical protein
MLSLNKFVAMLTCFSSKSESVALATSFRLNVPPTDGPRNDGFLLSRIDDCKSLYLEAKQLLLLGES